MSDITRTVRKIQTAPATRDGAYGDLYGNDPDDERDAIQSEGAAPRTREDEHAEVKRLTKEGFGPVDIAKALDLSVDFVSRSRRRQGLLKKNTNPLAKMTDFAEEIASHWRTVVSNFLPKWDEASDEQRAEAVSELERSIKASHALIGRLNGTLPLDAPPDEDFFGGNDESANDTTPGDGPKVWTALDVVNAWEAEGPLVHLPTGFPTLDERTGGGPVAGCRVYILGAPDAGKTAVLAQLADVYEAQGYIVGILCVDEEPGDLVTRFMQRRNWQRRDCEIRDPEHMERMKGDAAGMSLRIYDDESTIESAAADLAAAATVAGKPPVLLVDSVQTTRASAAAEDMSPREKVTAVVRAIRVVSTKHRMLVVATSEMNRGAYRSSDAAEQTNDMAAGKESGAIEYGARLMLALRSIKDRPGIIEVRIPKNKLGPTGDPFFLAVDRAHMTLTECEAPEGLDKGDDSKRERNLRDLADLATKIVNVVLDKPGIGEVALRTGLRATGHGIGVDKFNAVIEYAIQQGLLENRAEVKGDKSYAHYFAVPQATGKGCV